jgi:ribosome-associated protein
LADQNKLVAIVEWLNDKKAENIRVYDVEKASDYTDLLVVCEGSADLHNRAIANHVLDNAKQNHLKMIGKAGLDHGNWILIDLGDLIVHIFLPEIREYYKIDDLFEKISTSKTEEPKHDKTVNT